MKKSRWLQIAGIGLILCGLLALLAGSFLGESAQGENRRAVEKILSLLPPCYSGVTDQYSNMDMPSLEVEGQDYIALLEAPKYGAKLPVKGKWSAIGAENCPCLFRGTVYDGSLVIGGSSKAGQLAFVSQIQNGDILVVTDMTGGQFTYRVTKIFRTDSAGADVLVDESADLTVFAWNGAGLEYIVVRCETQT